MPRRCGWRRCFSRPCFYFIAFLGRDSGIQLNYIGAAAVALAVLGVKRLPLAIAIALLPSSAISPAWFLFPPDQALVIEDDWFLDQLYVNSAISIMAIIFLIVFYGFRLAYLAEAADRRAAAQDDAGRDRAAAEGKAGRNHRRFL